MKNTVIYLVLSLLFLMPGKGKAQEGCMHTSAASHTPLGIMGSHTHTKGSWMFSYQLMHMNMQNNLTGRENIAQEHILDHYMMAPGSMKMQMHMAGAMYAVTDRLTLMGMLPYISNQMTMTDRMGMAASMHNSNIGDVSISGLYNVLKGHKSSLILNMGMSIPTGSIDESISMEHMHHAENMCLPYMMQTSSGTWDLLPAVTYMSIHKSFAYGIQGQGRIRTGENSKAYRLGHMAGINSWLSYRQNSWLSYSLRAQALKTWQLMGGDAELNPMMSPASNALNTGGAQINSFIGSNFSIGKGALKGQRLSLELGIPLYQHLNGIQMQSRSILIAGWQLAF